LLLLPKTRGIVGNLAILALIVLDKGGHLMVRERVGRMKRLSHQTLRSVLGFIAIVAGLGLVANELPAAASTSTVPTIAWSNHVQASPSGINWASVAYGNGRFVAVGSTSTDGVVAISSDGQNWTTTTQGTARWAVVTYGDGRFVAIGEGLSAGTSEVMTLADGSTMWQPGQLSSTTTGWSSLIWTGGEFVAADFNDEIYASPDGTSWTYSAQLHRAHIGSLLSFGSAIIAFGAGVGSPSQWTSTDGGQSWSQPVATPFFGYGAAAGNGTAVIVANPTSGSDTTSPVVATSSDGTTWTTQTGGKGIDWNQVSYGDGLFVAEADHYGASSSPVVMISTDGVSWTLEPGANDLTDGRWSAIAPGIIVTVGDAGQIETGTYASPTTPTTTAPTTTTATTTPSPTALAATGANLAAPLALSLSLLGLGGVMLGRRRRGVRA
jgi:hypothetical protein